MSKRPSYSEISRKIKQAKESLASDKLLILKPIVIASDALDLGYSFEGIRAVMSDLLGEIAPRNYVGQSPPQRSYEDEIFQSELFAFEWESRRLGCKTYLKFSFKDDHLWLVSLHENRVDRKGR